MLLVVERNRNKHRTRLIANNIKTNYVTCNVIVVAVEHVVVEVVVVVVVESGLFTSSRAGRT